MTTTTDVQTERTFRRGEETTPMTLPTNYVYTFTIKKKNTQHLRMQFKDEDEEPLAGLPYELKVKSQTFTGTTDDDGRLEHDVPDDAETGDLKIWMDEDKSDDPFEWPIKIKEHVS